MLVIKGRIVDFIRNRSLNGYAEFIFKSDYDKDCPRFEAICSGTIPDVVPGVPIKVEFRVDNIKEIKIIDFIGDKIEKLTKDIKKANMNNIAYVCINYNDEDYAQLLLKQVKGISTKTANKILDAVDGDISKLSELWEDTVFWKGMRGSKKYLEELKSSLGSMIEKDILVKNYQKYGIGYPQVEMLISMYGIEAEHKLCQNPYSVLYRLDLDFQVADNLAKDLNFHYLSVPRIRALIRNVLSTNEQCGNTAIKKRDFYIKCAQMHKFSAWKDYVVSPYMILCVLSQMKDVYCENDFIGFIKTLNYESDIAYHLSRLMKAETKLNVNENYYNQIKDKYNKEQLEFLKAFDKNSVTILLGRGGTGKTHTICGAIDLFKKQYPNEKIRLCAPTARAAGVLKEHSGHESSTIHIMLELSPYDQEDAGKNEDNPLDAKMIVVDEMSMVDTNLFYYLLKAVKSGSKLILSGDIDQLESVGCGSILKDLVESQKVPVVRLKKIMRQNEGSVIIDNCGKILNGKYNFLTNDKFIVRNCETEEEAKSFLLSCYQGDPHNTQILSTTKKGLIGTVSLNKEFENTELPGIWLNGSYFVKGDKVIFTRNNYDSEYCNGDIGFIETIELPILVRMQGENKIIQIDKEDSVDMEHANVITTHKSQGGEYKHVYIMLPENPLSLLTRNMVNTAISRARETVVFINVKNALRLSASNKYKRNRITRLKEKLLNIGE